MTEHETPCVYCHGTGEVGSEIFHGPGWTVCVDRKTEVCPRCSGHGSEPDPVERIRLGLVPANEVAPQDGQTAGKRGET
jgi:hypothetical protein